MTKILRKVFLTVNVLVICGMLITGFADYLNPNTWGWLAMAGYGFPLFVILNVFMIVIWVLTSIKMTVVPLGAMIVCYFPIMKYCPLNLSKDVPADAITILSYNTWNYGISSPQANEGGADSVRAEMFRYIASRNPDVLCMQEAALAPGICAMMDSILPNLVHRDSLTAGTHNSMVMLSRYPIRKKERIDYESEGNLSCAFTLNIGGRDVVVINNHLETNSFSPEEKENFSEMMHGNKEKRSIKTESRFLLSKLTTAAKLRAPEAEAVARYVRMHGETPIILCGDFNDIPISYATRTMSENLTDCYVEEGNGFGFSYHHNAMRVRIDNIMCSSHFKVFECKVDNSISLSDHYPIEAKIAFK